MQMLPNEQVLISDKSNRLRVTNLRVRYQFSDGGQGTISSIMLEQVASCVVHERSYHFLLGLGILAGLVGVGMIANESTGAGGVAIVVAIVCVAAYYRTRQHLLSVGSAGATIDVPFNGMSTDQVVAVMDTIEQAKFQRRGGS